MSEWEMMYRTRLKGKGIEMLETYTVYSISVAYSALVLLKATYTEGVLTVQSRFN